MEKVASTPISFQNGGLRLQKMEKVASTPIALGAKVLHSYRTCPKGGIVTVSDEIQCSTTPGVSSQTIFAQGSQLPKEPNIAKLQDLFLKLISCLAAQNPQNHVKPIDPKFCTKGLLHYI